MSENESQEIRTDVSEPKFFVMIPHMVINTKLSHAAFRLYCYYKATCGEEKDGKCFRSLAHIAEDCHMRRATVIDGRKELEEKKLVSVTTTKRKNGSRRVIVTIANVWAENTRREKERRRYDPATEPPDGIVRSGNSPQYDPATCLVRSGYSNKNPYKNNPKKNKQVRGRLPSGKQPHTSNGLLVSSFDEEAARRLRSIFTRYDSDLQRSRVKTLAYQISRLRNDGKSEDRIKVLFKWMYGHYGDEFTPKWYKASDVFDRFKQMEDAATRLNGSNSNGRTNKTHQAAAELIEELRNE